MDFDDTIVDLLLNKKNIYDYCERKKKLLQYSFSTLDLRCEGLTEIPHLLQYINITKLDIGDNYKVTKIENLPPTLKKLYISFNNFTVLENLPEGLEELHIACNKIKKLQNLPSTLKKLYIWFNDIEVIENLPYGLEVLDISNNKVKYIHSIPITLKELDMHHNKIKIIPFEISLMNNLSYISYAYNPVEFIHPLALRKINKIQKKSEFINPMKNRNNLFNDEQNIHDSNIQKSFIKSMNNILKDKIFDKEILYDNSIFNFIKNLYIWFKNKFST